VSHKLSTFKTKAISAKFGAAAKLGAVKLYAHGSLIG
jgi:hypothetical protein